ncbi:MAG: MerR family transcriptional regulator [Deltaproteobacteria bacterium]|nr:MerR family transcriptional regulator [Deltaproteobacteria bacterium]
MKANTKKKNEPDLMNIGQFAGRANVTTHTVRYYEKIGVLRNNNKRAANGYRVYSERDLYALRLVRRAKLLGLTLAETREMSGFLWEDSTERKLIEKSVEICEKYQEKTEKKIKELVQYKDLLGTEIKRLKTLL